MIHQHGHILVNRRLLVTLLLMLTGALGSISFLMTARVSHAAQSNKYPRGCYCICKAVGETTGTVKSRGPFLVPQITRATCEALRASAPTTRPCDFWSMGYYTLGSTFGPDVILSIPQRFSGENYYDWNEPPVPGNPRGVFINGFDFR